MKVADRDLYSVTIQRMPEVQRAHDNFLHRDLMKDMKVAHAHPKANGFGKEAHGHAKVKICVSGAAETGHCGLNAYETGKNLGREIVRNGCVLTTGATTGMPLYAAVGCKEEGGFSIGFSPASTEKEHVEVYKLPLDYMDIVVYTGFGFPGRDLLLTRSSDAVILGCGRVGTIHEFTIAYEDRKPVGILEGPWDTDEVLHHIMKASNRPMDTVISDTDPKALVERIAEMVQKQKSEYNMVYKNDDHIGGTEGDLIL